MAQPFSWKHVAAYSAVAIYFLLLTHGGLTTYFTSDDLINIAFLHGYGRVPFVVVLARALTVFTSEYRPFGGLYYRTLYAVFGLHPLPFRIVFFSLLGANLALTARWFRRLSGSAAVALAGTLLFSFHPALAELYYNDGTIYDVLCVLFVLLAFSRYTRIRQADRSLTLSGFLGVAALYGGALESKEMAISLPAILILYEIIFHPGLQDLRRRVLPILGLAGMTMLCMVWKVLVPNEMSMQVNGNYTPRYEPGFVGHAFLRYYGLLCFRSNLTGKELAVGLALALLAGVLVRDRLMLFGFFFANIALLPVCVIPPRAGFVWYMPMLGWALYGGSAASQIAGAFQGAPQRIGGEQPRFGDVATSIEPLLFAALTVGLYLFQAPRARSLDTPFLPEQKALKELLEAAQGVSPRLPPGSRVLLQQDPFPADSWLPLFLFRLGYHDPTLWVTREGQLGNGVESGDTSLYTLVMRWNGSNYQSELQDSVRGELVTFVVTPLVIHRDESAAVQFPLQLAGCAIDAAYRMPNDELMRSGVWHSWAQLRSDGTGTVAVGRDAERGTVVVDHIRACHGEW